jgi:Tol biopolymer transport system component
MKHSPHPTATYLFLSFLPIFTCFLCPDTSAAQGAVLTTATSLQSSSGTPRDRAILAGMKTALTRRIFFISNAGGAKAIWTVPPEGGAQELLLSYPDLNIISVNVSPTGDSIAYITHDLSGDYNTGVMWLADIDGKNASPVPMGTLTPHEPAAWSPDGQVLVFSTLAEGLYRIDRDGTNLQPLTPPLTSHHYDDDPDVSVRNEVAYNNRLIGEIRVATLSGAGNLIRSVTGGTAPQWSPDGARILYNELGVGLRIMNRDGSNDRILLAEQAGEDLYSADWNSTGILYVRVDETTGDQDVWAIDLDGSNNRQLTSGPAIDQRPQWGFGELDAGVKDWFLLE